MDLSNNLEERVWQLLSILGEDKGQSLRDLRHTLLRLDLPAKAPSMDDQTLLVFHIISRMVSDIWRNFACDASFSFPQEGKMGESMAIICREITRFATTIRESNQQLGCEMKYLMESIRAYYNCVALIDHELLEMNKEFKS
jgi:hypothetical protein